MLVDSHCHLDMLDLTPYGGKLELLVEEAKNVGVEHILCVGCNLINAFKIIEISEKFDNISASLGLHPSEIVDHEPTVIELIRLASHSKIVAIGETGLDYYNSKVNVDIMKNRFRCHIQAAIKLSKPLIIHSRNASVDTIQIMKEEKAETVNGVMHCFTEDIETARQAMNLGFYISFSGIVTFKNAKNIVEVAKYVPLEKMLIETDAPYLTPVPFRGRKNEPKYVRYTAERVAELKNISLSKTAKKTTKNYYDLFLSNDLREFPS
ncbi:TatD family hydrolase [Coxiella endosymbiont of Amblyomma americanum]|uniref:TatD family hydrolase n=1 Tax=Coxiella endosymbiont of Amblyomma americanum TaxID=325775 RepID=UPI00057D68D3|nr:TatD family hydrolase [Coxiella endosymbiont of Amblyomma americanum]AJC50663.1 deoxyribonuclease [Coxiella endosymbiont of Amblyomma americanum]